MAIQDYYEFPTAYNPDTQQLQRDALFQVFATTDRTFSTPLQVLEAVSGVMIEQLRSSDIGMLPSFRVQGDPTQIFIKSGAFVTRLSSKYGFALEAGLDPATVQKAIAAADRAETAAVRAEQASGGGSAGLTPEPGMSGYYLIGD